MEMRKLWDRRRGPRRREDLRQEEAGGVHYKKIAWGALGAYAFVVTVAAVALFVQGIHNSKALHTATKAVQKSEAAVTKANSALSIVEAAEAMLRVQQVQGCVRENVLRVNDNISHQADYAVDLFINDRFLVPTKTETVRQKQITAQFEVPLRHSVKVKQWTPLTNCAASASKAGSKYRAPQPIPFRIKEPPASALSIKNALRVDPVGSVS